MSDPSDEPTLDLDAIRRDLEARRDEVAGASAGSPSVPSGAARRGSASGSGTARSRRSAG